MSSPQSSLSSRSTAARSRPALGLAFGGVVATLVAACGTAPDSFLYDRQVYYRATLNRYPVQIVSIDGTSPSAHPAPVTMGDHRLAIDAPPVAGFALPVRKVYSLTVAPCTRYYLAAQRPSRLSQDWDLIVEQTVASGGCDPAQELQKAREAAARGEQPPITSSVAELTGPPSTPQPGVLVSPVATQR